MERSQSFTNFSTAGGKGNKNNNNKKSTCKRHNSTLTINLCKTIELYEGHLHHVASSENLSTLKMPDTALPPFPSTRKKTLKRQKSSIYTDDIDYAADLEEEAEEEGKPYATVQHRKHLPQFQQHRKPLLVSAASASSVVSSSSAITTTTTISKSSSSATSAVSFGHQLKHDSSFDSCSTAADMSPLSLRHNFCMLQRDNSLQSDSSRYSSVDSLLESRKPDPEAILINLGFGPVDSEDILSRIPKRFLKPSQVRGIDTEAFVRRLHLASSLADHSVLGYRGLTGNPDIPPSTIVAKIMERFEVNQRKKSMGSLEHTIR